MTPPARLHGPLRLEEVLDANGKTAMRGGRPVWRLLEPLEFRLFGLNSAYRLTVPAGFETDLASVPWFVRGIIPASGPWQRAAIVHDWLYATKGTFFHEHYPCRRARLCSDYAFFVAMQAADVPNVICYLMWKAVRLFGWTGWGR
ncbi:MAG: hypothetical protein RLZZ157_100 [Pseudomonadota bacterium]|jgi:hypothetical protein